MVLSFSARGEGLYSRSTELWGSAPSPQQMEVLGLVGALGWLAAAPWPSWRFPWAGPDAASLLCFNSCGRPAVPLHRQPPRGAPQVQEGVGERHALRGGLRGHQPRQRRILPRAPRSGCVGGPVAFTHGRGQHVGRPPVFFPGLESWSPSGMAAASRAPGAFWFLSGSRGQGAGAECRSTSPASLEWVLHFPFYVSPRVLPLQGPAAQ